MDDTRARTVLMVLFHFPPLGGVAVPRNVHNVEHLPRFGWTPVVVTPRDADGQMDPEMLTLIPLRTRVYRAWCPEPRDLRRVVDPLRGMANMPRWLRRAPADTVSHRGSEMAPTGGRAGQQPHPPRPAPAWLWRLHRLLAFPDSQVGWLPFALIAALRAHRNGGFDVVYSTSAPITAHLVAGIIKRLTGVPWVAEFRDPWVGNTLAAPLPWFHRRLQVKLERWIVGSADRVVGLSPSITRLYRTRYPQAANMVTITNGYDRSEAQRQPPHERVDGRFRLTYTGTLDRPAEFQTFLEGLDALVTRRPDLGERLEVAFYGSVADSCRAIADRYLAGRLQGILELRGFVARRDALAALASADAALILLGPGPGMGLFIGSKLFDYIGLDLQILAMLPRGDARDILEGLDWGVICDPDPTDVNRAIEHLMTLPAPDRPADPAGIYDRAVLAGRLATSLDEVAAAVRLAGGRSR